MSNVDVSVVNVRSPRSRLEFLDLWISSACRRRFSSVTSLPERLLAAKNRAILILMIHVDVAKLRLALYRNLFVLSSNLYITGVQVWNAGFRQQMVHRSSLCCKIRHYDNLLCQTRTSDKFEKRVNSVDISQQAVSNRLREMGKIRKTGRWVLRVERRVNEQARNTRDTLLARYKRKPILHRIVAGDEKSIHFENPKRKKSWADPGAPSTSTARPNHFDRKTLNKALFIILPNLTCFHEKIRVSYLHTW